MGKGIEISKRIEGLPDSIRSIIIDARKNVTKNINTELLPTYWKIEKLIVDVESSSDLDQKSSRQLILNLSNQLSKGLGSAFSHANLFNMRNFYLEYQNVLTVSGQISWSHYYELLIIEGKTAHAQNSMLAKCITPHTTKVCKRVGFLANALTPTHYPKRS